MNHGDGAMTLESAFSELSTCLLQLDETLAKLRSTVVFRPVEGESVLVDLFRDAADDLLGLNAEAVEAVGQLNGEPHLEMEQLRRRLTTCHQKYQELNHRFNRDPMAYHRLASLDDIGRRRGREWKHWAQEVKAELERCQQAIDSVDRSLLACWLELTQEIGRNFLTVQATGIGQIYGQGSGEPQPDQRLAKE